MHSAVGFAAAQGNCPPLSSGDSSRRDCYPWSDGNQANCEARGCVWCPSETGGVPWCFINDEVCPSEIPEASRSDCYSEGGATRDLCLGRGCVWCPTSTPNIPWCFTDGAISMGGQQCPSDISDANRVDCFPMNGASADLCVARGCYWCSSSVPDTPWCFSPQSHGYRMVGNEVVTAKGYRVTLQRVNTPSWYGSEINQVTVDVEFHTDSRLRVKVSPSSAVKRIRNNLRSVVGAYLNRAMAACLSIFKSSLSEASIWFENGGSWLKNGSKSLDTGLKTRGSWVLKI